ncbi:MAG: hypothetical protein FWE21_06400 [Defluviitaleaceae bacterium]|nr:hypothetical protein [Defluviitaleaceae bacterium]
MKLWKYLLIAALIFSALFLIVYGSLLMISPDNINITLNFEDVSSDEQLQIVIFLYGKLFLAIAFAFIINTILVIKDSPLGIIFAIGQAVLMMNAGVLSFIMTGDATYLYADLVRGLLLLILVILYYFMYYRRKVLRK